MAGSDVIVLGAGMVGVSTALHLQKRGRAVVLIDRRGAGEETSYGNTGIIEGTVSDPSGRAVPRAQITITNLGTNFSRQLSSDEEGSFRRSDALFSTPPPHLLYEDSLLECEPLVPRAALEPLAAKLQAYANHIDRFDTFASRRMRARALLAERFGDAPVSLMRFFEEHCRVRNAAPAEPAARTKTAPASAIPLTSALPRRREVISFEGCIRISFREAIAHAVAAERRLGRGNAPPRRTARRR